MDDEVLVEGRLLEWGNSLGIRVRRADLEKAGLGAGRDVLVRIQAKSGKIDLSHVRTFRSGHTDTSERHDDVLGEAQWNARAKPKGKRRARR
jgi:antitoxin component of MazEF toxin-antitoxin module